MILSKTLTCYLLAYYLFNCLLTSFQFRQVVEGTTSSNPKGIFYFTHTATLLKGNIYSALFSALHRSNLIGLLHSDGSIWIIQRCHRNDTFESPPYEETRMAHVADKFLCCPPSAGLIQLLRWPLHHCLCTRTPYQAAWMRLR